MKLTRDLKEFIGLLNAQAVEYLLVGGWAFGFHSTPRYTGDIDFFVKPDEQNRQRMKKVLNEFGFSDLSHFEAGFLKPGRIIQFGLPPSRIDVLTEISGVTFAEAWESRVQGEIDGVSVPVISRECLIRNKTVAGRGKDLADLDALNKPPRSH